MKTLLAQQHPVRDVKQQFPPQVSAETADAKPFHIYQPAFLDLLGVNPTLDLLIEDLNYAFAWEAPLVLLLVCPHFLSAAKRKF